MPKTPSDAGGGSGAGPECVPPLSWHLRPASSLGLLSNFPAPSYLLAESLRWDPAWAWEQLARSPRERREPTEMLAESEWWKVENDAESDALDRLWRNSVAAALAARTLAEEAGVGDLDQVERLGLLHRLDYWFVAIKDLNLFVRIMAKPGVRRVNRLASAALGDTPIELAFRWSVASERTEELIHWCANVDGPERRFRDETAQTLALVAKGRRLADRTRWRIRVGSHEEIESDPRVVELEAMVERACSDKFISSLLGAGAEPFARRCATLELERTSAERKVRRLDNRIVALRSSLGERSKRLETELERRKLEALAEFAAGAGHELNNPLAVVQGRAQMLLSKERNQTGDRARSLQAIIEQAQRAHWMIRDLMFIARPPELTFVDCSPTEVLKLTLVQQRPYAAMRRIALTLEKDARDDRFISDVQALRHLAEAFIRNAIEASPDGSEVSVGCRIAPSRLTIWFRDRGSGIDKRSAKRLFDPFFCGRAAGRGLGLGLPRAAVIVRKMGGKIRWSSCPNGSLFRVVLPRRIPTVNGDGKKPRVGPGAG
jgi:two-component system, NtrC family, sensor kinase